jgi:hypothetical protein
MGQRNIEADQGLQNTDENCVIVKGPIRGDRRVKVRGIALQKTVVQYFASLEKKNTA